MDEITSMASNAAKTVSDVWVTLDPTEHALYFRLYLASVQLDNPNDVPVGFVRRTTAAKQEMALRVAHWLGIGQGVLLTYVGLRNRPDLLGPFIQSDCQMPLEWVSCRPDRALVCDSFADDREYAKGVERYARGWKMGARTTAEYVAKNGVPPSRSAKPAAGSAPVARTDADSTSSEGKSTGLSEDIVIELATSLGGRQLIWGALDESTRAFYVATFLDCWRQDAPEMRLISRGRMRAAHDQEMNLQRLHWLGYCRGILETYASLVANTDALVEFAEASMDHSNLPPDWPKSRAESVLERDAYADAGEYEAAIERYSAAWYRASFTFAMNMLQKAVSE